MEGVEKEPRTVILRGVASTVTGCAILGTDGGANGVPCASATRLELTVFKRFAFLFGSITENIGSNDNVAKASSIVFFLAIPRADRS